MLFLYHVLLFLYHVALGCTNGAVRIINGSSSAEGTVEVCYYNTWGLVADGGWGSEEAQVVCRQLYYSGTPG